MSRIRSSSRAISAALAGTALLVAGCAELRPHPPPPPPVVARPVPVRRPAPARPVAAPPPAQAPAAPDHVEPQPPASEGVATAVAPPVDLVGRSRAQVTGLLGEPTARKDLASGQSWTYRAGDCSLEVLFFLDLSRNDFYALQQHVTGGDGTPAGEQRCLEAIRHAHRS